MFEGHSDGCAVVQPASDPVGAPATSDENRRTDLWAPTIYHLARGVRSHLGEFPESEPRPRISGISGRDTATGKDHRLAGLRALFVIRPPRSGPHRRRRSPADAGRRTGLLRMVGKTPDAHVVPACNLDTQTDLHCALPHAGKSRAEHPSMSASPVSANIVLPCCGRGSFCFRVLPAAAVQRSASKDGDVSRAESQPWVGFGHGNPPGDVGII